MISFYKNPNLEFKTKIEKCEYKPGKVVHSRKSQVCLLTDSSEGWHGC